MEDYMGMVRMFGGNFAPRYFMQCNGQILSIAQNTALFSLLGTSFGGNGQTTFGLPNMQGRAPIGWGTSPFGSYVLGEMAGSPSVTITLSNMPAHTHPAVFNGAGSSVTIPAPTIMASSAVGTSAAPAAATNTLGQLVVPRASGVALYNNAAPDTALNVGGQSSTAPVTVTGTVTNGVVGSSLPVDITNPYVALTFVIVTQGIYPSRN